MANSKLINKNTYYTVPQHVIEEVKKNLLKNPNTYSTVRQKAENIIQNKFLTYENLKRIKNLFDSVDETDIDLKPEERELQRQQKKNDLMFLGGNKMKNWVESQLGSLRNPIQRSKKAKSNFAGFTNEFREKHTRPSLKAPQQQSIKNKILSELKPKKLMESEENNYEVATEMKFACVCLIFNEENKLLLVRRSDNDNWMPGKFALVGGGIEENEIPEETIIRETKEEVNLTIKKPKLVYSTIEGDTFLYVFIAKVNNSDKIKLNDEHSGYVWVGKMDLDKYDTVPNLADMIKKVHEIIINNNK
jgi:8-oxo-dGTP diphosphatase